MYQPYPGSDTQLPPAQRSPAPASVRNAVTVMYAGAAASLLGIVTLDTAVGLVVPLAGAVKLWGVLVWLIGLVAVVFLWRPASTAYFRQAPA